MHFSLFVCFHGLLVHSQSSNTLFYHWFNKPYRLLFLHCSSFQNFPSPPLTVIIFLLLWLSYRRCLYVQVYVCVCIWNTFIYSSLWAIHLCFLLVFMALLLYFCIWIIDSIAVYTYIWYYYGPVLSFPEEYPVWASLI